MKIESSVQTVSCTEEQNDYAGLLSAATAHGSPRPIDEERVTSRCRPVAYKVQVKKEEAEGGSIVSLLLTAHSTNRRLQGSRDKGEPPNRGRNNEGDGRLTTSMMAFLDANKKKD
ncbi:hypothetical protein Ccrd_017185 [Cynara cardunculus var. scolymus]|uniref:Uncharacterized protein n=1 Tax=Cynara cardunculus var. scolymus TaxID=59895 RepID=A0A103Y8J0_CYNCS|nr:hypothetical protein Ccrd_017185 [Cynara cardunculus var. scolymus]